MPLVRPAHGWNYQYVTTSPGEMLAEEFLKPLGLSQHRLAMSIRVPSTRIGEIVRGKRAMLHEHMGCQVVTPQCRKHRLSVQHKARSQASSS